MLPEYNNCLKIVYLCPAVPKGSCEWEGDASGILQHFQELHTELLIESNTIKADVIQDSEHNRLMVSEERLFLIQTKVSLKKGKFWIRLRFLGPAEELLKVRYSVEITSGKFGFYNKNPSDEYNPVYNVENGVEVDIQAINLMSGVKNIENLTVHIYLNEINELTEKVQSEEEKSNDYPAVNSSFDDLIFDDPPDNESDTTDSRGKALRLCEAFQELNFQDKWELKDIEESSEIDEEFSDSDGMIECTNCRHNMIPPIYMCPDGHSVCYGCKSQKCSVCGQGITELRNIDLEQHSKTLDYPCRYEPHGCTKTFKYDQIRKHEIYCDFCSYKCEICGFVGRLNEIKGHFRIAHPSTKMYDRMTDIHFPRGSNFIIINDSGVFYCTSRTTETYVEWMVVFCGPKERFFSCEVRVTGKKQYNTPKHYFLKRIENVFKWSVPFEELKNANVKEKYSTLSISSYY